MVLLIIIIYSNNFIFLDSTEITPRCSAAVDVSGRPTKIARTVPMSGTVESGEEQDDSENEDCDMSSDAHVGIFGPLYAVSIWKEPETMTRRITLAVILPSGVDAGGFSLRVVDGGQFLEITVKWPRPLIDLNLMHKKWLGGPDSTYQVYHPEFIGFQEGMKKLRQKSTDWIESLARIPLPFPVETHIHDKHNLAWRDDSTKLLYIRLKASVEQYAVNSDKEQFEVL